jgi:hypothetical protein
MEEPNTFFLDTLLALFGIVGAICFGVILFAYCCFPPSEIDPFYDTPYIHTVSTVDGDTL